MGIIYYIKVEITCRLFLVECLKFFELQKSDAESDRDSSSEASEIRAPLELLGEFLTYVRRV